ncbi:MAG TPA: hypothetical protein DEB05_11615 [Firmicutes bacterium]|jgi:excisionase family DNA binding protein|nr:hypothetical protein [Bacillota bacterium]
MPKEVLNLEEASELLGVSSKTLLKILREEEVPARKIGREWRFSRNALLNWLAAGNSLAYVSAEQGVKEYFDQVAPHYNATRVQYYGSNLCNLIFTHITIEQNMSVADIGCGTGYLTKALAEKATRVTAIDSSGEMLEIARQEIDKAGLSNVEFINADASKLPFPVASFDLVFASMLLHHISDPVEVLKEFNRILKAGGQVVLIDVEEHPHRWVKEEKSDLWLGFDRAELAEWLKEAGFSEETVADLGCDCYTTGSQGRSAHIKMIIATGKKQLN